MSMRTYSKRGFSSFVRNIFNFERNIFDENNWFSLTCSLDLAVNFVKANVDQYVFITLDYFHLTSPWDQPMFSESVAVPKRSPGTRLK